MYRTVLILFIAFIIAVGTAVVLCFNTFDTVGNRRIASSNIREIIDLARKNPNDTRYAQSLLSMSHSNWDFEACLATNALGDIGPAASPFIHEIAQLMNSPKPCVSQEAAKSLKRLGVLSEPVLQELIVRINQKPADATTWFAVQALGKIGRPAYRYIGQIKAMQPQEPEMFKGTVKRTISEIESAMGKAPN